MSDVWYYADDSGTVGPLTLDSLKATLGTMPDRETVLVWRDGFSDWQTVAATVELRPIPKPPPLPRWPSKRGPIEGKNLNPNLAGSQGGKPVSEKKPGFLKSAAGWVVILIVIAVAGAVGRNLGHEGFLWLNGPSQSDTEVKLHAGFKKARDQMKFPQKLDDTTILTNMTYEGRQITYTHDFDAKNYELNARTLNLLKDYVAKKVCKQEPMTKLMPLGVSYRYTYKDSTGQDLGSFIIDEEECRRQSL